MTRLSRRGFLAKSGLIGCSLAASPLLTPVSFAAAPWERRLVVIILRGGMDGLDVVRPVAAPEWRDLRPSLDASSGKGVDLDGFFALHPGLTDLLPLWAKGELGFVHAVSTPYRDRRSHFDGQDLLEAGTPGLNQRRDGWLNRALQHLPGAEADTAYALGQGEMKLAMGAAPVADWSPRAQLRLSPQALRLAELTMEGDRLFAPALSEAARITDGFAEQDPARGPVHRQIAEFAASRLRADARIATFSLNGWDTHLRQGAAIGRALQRLAETVLLLRDGLGAQVWSRTAIVAMTEFGRTVRENGTRGTDHGTGGAMILAGGALRGGRVLGRWPGLDEASLYDRRDLMPTGDVRAPAAWLLRAATGLDRATLERDVFPGLDMGEDPSLLL